MSTSVPAKVLVMASTFPRHAGDTLPSFVLRLCQAVRDQGWEPVALVPHARGLPAREILGGVACHRFRYAPAGMELLAYGGGMLANVRARRWLWLVLPFYLAALLLAALRLVRRERIAVVHAHWILPQGLVAVLLKKMLFWRPLRVVVTAHGSDLNALGGLAGRLLGWAMRQADAVSVVSEGLRQRALALGVPADKVVVASMGVDTGLFAPPSGPVSRQGLLFVGRLVPEKGVAFLLQALADLLPRHPGLTLCVVGDGPLRGALEAQAEALGVAPAVTFRGALPPAALPALYGAAAVLVMPSEQEGFGLVAAEALGCGCPVVAHDLPGIRDLVLPGQTGIMVAPGDVPALAEGIAALLADPPRAAAMGEAGRRHIVANYGWEAVAARYGRLYAP